MESKKKILDLIARMDGIDRLKDLQDVLHDFAQLAMNDGRDHDFNDFCECENACHRRILELEGADK